MSTLNNGLESTSEESAGGKVSVRCMSSSMYEGIFFSNGVVTLSSPMAPQAQKRGHDQRRQIICQLDSFEVQHDQRDTKNQQAADGVDGIDETLHSQNGLENARDYQGEGPLHRQHRDR